MCIAQWYRIDLSWSIHIIDILYIYRLYRYTIYHDICIWSMILQSYSSRWTPVPRPQSQSPAWRGGLCHSSASAWRASTLGLCLEAFSKNQRLRIWKKTTTNLNILKIIEKNTWDIEKQKQNWRSWKSIWHQPFYGNIALSTLIFCIPVLTGGRWPSTIRPYSQSSVSHQASTRSAEAMQRRTEDKTNKKVWKKVNLKTCSPIFFTKKKK